MELVEYSRALVPFIALLTFLFIDRKRKEFDEQYSGMKCLSLTYFGRVIVWFSVLVSSILLSQLIITPPEATYSAFLFLLLIAAILTIAVEHLTYRVYFNDHRLVIISALRKPNCCEFYDVLSVKEKVYGGDNGKVYVIILENKKIRIPTSMLGGDYFHEFDPLLRRKFTGKAL
ncbi:hypothetical protein [Photobacterium marinum]|uniref:hypothetical protein n=1 Tax=Photobacterium marinum TaxID=1056511 RepID=UPI00056D8966|nr:hypothetical protein [Photobacterium marinum]